MQGKKSARGKAKKQAAKEEAEKEKVMREVIRAAYSVPDQLADLAAFRTVKRNGYVCRNGSSSSSSGGVGMRELA